MQKAMDGANTFFITLKHGADTFFTVSGLRADTFFHYLETKEKLFTEKRQLQLYFSLKYQTIIEMQLHYRSVLKKKSDTERSY